jgi:hypothetical protein
MKTAVTRIPATKLYGEKRHSSHQVVIAYLECVQEVLKEMEDLCIRELRHVVDKLVTQGLCDWRQLRKIALSRSKGQSKDSLTGERYQSGHRDIVHSSCLVDMPYIKRTQSLPNLQGKC